MPRVKGASQRVSVAYLDTSVLLAIVFDEPDAHALEQRVGEYTRLTASNLLEAEVRSAYARSALQFTPSLEYSIEWINPQRTLGPELERALDTGSLRGADLWHVACALYLSPDPGQLTFVTLDQRQRAVAATLAFVT